MVNLISSWKRLVKGCDYTALDNAVTASQSILNQAATPEENNTYKVFTKDSYDAFYAAYTAAKKIDRNLADTVENNKKIAEIAQNLVDAIANIKEVGQGGTDPVWALLADAGYTTYNAYSEPYSPWIEESRALLDYIGSVYLEEYGGADLTGLIFGIPEGGVSAVGEIINESSLENVTVEITENAGGIYGTGSLIIIRNAGTEEIIGIYMVILRGDINCDGEISAIDQMELDPFLSYEEDWTGDETLKYKYFAADVNYDFEADSIDTMYLDQYFSYDIDISQIEQGGAIDAGGSFIE